jgi:hypothetical protein
MLEMDNFERGGITNEMIIVLYVAYDSELIKYIVK